jgi:cytochrome c oxidase subunit 4
MSDASHSEHHGPNVNTYWTIFGCLLVLTIVTVAVSVLHLPATGAVILAIMIAISKASLVICFFMHVKYDPNSIRLMCVMPTMLTVVLLLALLPDVGMLEPRRAGVAPPPYTQEYLDEEGMEEDVVAETDY